MAQQHGRRRTGSGGKVSVGGRGSSVGHRPAGKTGGYSGGSKRPSTGSSSAGNRDVLTSLLGGGGSSSSGGSGCISAAAGLGLFSALKKNKKLRTIVIIIAIILVLWFLFGNGKDCLAGGGSGDYSDSPGITDSLGIAGTASTEQEADLSVSGEAREKYTSYPAQNATMTIMVYMCGTDLESDHGMATNDLKEMINAQIGEDVNVIVETGGTKKWKNKTISSDKNQIFKVTDGGMVLLEELKKKSMVEPDTLSEFIIYCQAKFPADRYALIFWDHGGGSVSGYGYDQYYQSDSMTLDEIDTALKNGGCKFDFIGFDACLMATLETAMVAERYADYLIASEETEPGVGWYYTDWLTLLSNNGSISTVELGKEIIDSFVETCARQTPGSKTTLSIIDLAELSGTVPETFVDFAESTSQLIEDNDYKKISDARSATREFSSNIDQVDVIDLANRIGTAEAKEFAAALKSCVKYNRTSSNIKNAYGVSIFFPYGKSRIMSSALKTYEKIGLDDSYGDCIKEFASVTAGGQIANGGGGSLMDSLFGEFMGSGSTQSQPSSTGSLLDVIGMLGGNTSTTSGSNDDMLSTMFDLFLKSKKSKKLTGIDVGQDEEWFDKDQVKKYKSYIADNYLDPDHVVITEDAQGRSVVSLTEEEWDLVQSIELCVFYDDGEGYIDLGMDSIFTRDEETGDLLIDYDGQWVTLNGQVASYYMLSEQYSDDGEDYVITGYIPALLNGESVQIIVVFDSREEEGIVEGYRPMYDDPAAPVAKTVTEFTDGDVIDLVCDFYDYEQNYSESYTFGTPITVNGELKVSDAELDLGKGSALYSYCLTDIYGNRIWTAQTEYVSLG